MIQPLLWSGDQNLPCVDLDLQVDRDVDVDSVFTTKRLRKNLQVLKILICVVARGFLVDDAVSLDLVKPRNCVSCSGSER